LVFNLLQENANFLFLDYKARHLLPELLLKINSFYNAPNYPNMGAFAILDPDGSITAWGSSNYGGKVN
jgi:hypothetical protein